MAPPDMALAMALIRGSLKTSQSSTTLVSSVMRAASDWDDFKWTVLALRWLSNILEGFSANFAAPEPRKKGTPDGAHAGPQILRLDALRSPNGQCAASGQQVS
jgi:hypothetical protein